MRPVHRSALGALRPYGGESAYFALRVGITRDYSWGRRRMFAVIKTGAKQYRAVPDAILTIEKLAADVGDVVQFNEVLMIRDDQGISVGAPRISDAAVQAEVLAQKRGDKVYAFQKRRRKHSSKRLRGHRQYLTTVRIKSILREGGGASGVRSAEAAPEAAE